MEKIEPGQLIEVRTSDGNSHIGYLVSELPGKPLSCALILGRNIVEINGSYVVSRRVIDEGVNHASNDNQGRAVRVSPLVDED